MASFIAINELKERLSEILDRVENGEDILIRREGHPPTRLLTVPVPLVSTERSTAQRTGGQNLLGITYIAPDFDAPMSDEELAQWGY